MSHYFVITCVLLICLVTSFVNFSRSQKILSEQEMVQLVGHNAYSFPNAQKQHTCAFLSLQGNVYTKNQRHDAYLECNCARRISDCQGKLLEVKRKCCPGFKAFLDEASEELCMERVLPRQTFKQTLIDMDATSISAALFDDGNGAAFNDSSETYTLFIVRDADSRITAEMMGQSQILSNKTDGKKCEPTKSDQIGKKILETSVEGKKKRLGQLQQECSRQENAKSNFTSPIFVHVAKGRIYTHSLNREYSVETLHSGGRKKTMVKFARYSNGIMCVECSLIKEANYEAANGVIHVVDYPFLNSVNQKSLATILQKEFPYFWSSVSAKLKALLKSNSCSGWFTVFVPSQAEWSEDNAVTAANHVIKGLWCTQGLVSQSSDNLATLAGDVIQLGCSGTNRETIFVTSNGRNAQIDGTERGRTFDRMASNGVIHLINGKLQSRLGSSFKFATQFNEDGVSSDPNDLTNQITSCGIKLLSNQKYIVLIPSRTAMKKFFAMKSSKNDAKLYIQSQEFRCQILRYHILLVEDGQSDLDRVMHLQKTYETLLGKKETVSDFLMTNLTKVTPYFMSAKSIEKLAFANGHIYRINQLLLPPNSQHWSSLLSEDRSLPTTERTTLTARLKNLAIMEAAAPLNSHCTHFVPPETNADSASLIRHSTKYLLWSNYLRVGDTLELPPCNEATTGDNLVLKRITKRLFTLGLVNSRFKVAVLASNILRERGMVWFINRSLPSTDTVALN